MKTSIKEYRTRQLCTLAIVLATCLGFTSQAIAQSCGGSIGMLNTPSSLNLTQVPLGEIVRVTLNPAKSNLSGLLTIDEVRYALACGDNDDQVPCTNGNDGADQGGAPISYVGNVGNEAGNCGATDGTTTDNGDGTVTFSFPAIDLDNTGCTITFDVEVNDKGTDASPLVLTSAAESNGVCPGPLNGSANGSAAVTLTTVPDIELLKEISIDGGTTWFDANAAGSAPYAEFPAGAMYRLTVTNTGTAALTNIVINDPTLGIVNFAIADLAAGDFVVLDSGDIPALSAAQVCDEGGTFQNIATVDAESADDGTPVSDNDPATLVCVGIDIDKTGDLEGKVGDDANYEITLSNLSEIVLGDCSVNDTLLGGIFGPGALAIGDTVLNESYTVQGGDPDPLPNTATLSCAVVGPVNTVNLQASDDHEVDLVAASIEVAKTGPATGKVGDDVCYDISFTSTGEAGVENCQADDSLLGALGTFEPGVPQEHCYTVQPGDPDPLLNEVTISCDVVGFSNQATDSDTHEVDLIVPAITVTKDGPDFSKVGDEACYDIEVTNTGDGDVENCQANDSLLGALGTFEPGVPQEHCYTVQPGDPDPLLNEVTVTCDVAGFDNQVEGSDTHEVDLLNPEAELSKDCRPDSIPVGDDVNWAITIDNTGDADLDCLVNDPTAGFTDEPVSVAAGGSETLNTSRATDPGDVPSITNIATASCTLTGGALPNVLELGPAEDTCEVTQVVEFCRTPGFWGSRAGNDKRRSTDLTQHVIDAAGGSLSICGQTIDNTDAGNVHSATEAMCVRIEGVQQRQLARQLTAMALNCVVSGGSANCTGTSVGTLFADANAACIANDTDLSSWIAQVDSFNNGIGRNCKETDFSDSEVFDGISPLPGPAGGTSNCQAANGNGWKVVPAPGGETP